MSIIHESVEKHNTLGKRGSCQAGRVVNKSLVWVNKLFGMTQKIITKSDRGRAD